MSRLVRRLVPSTALLLAIAFAVPARADIYRWDTGEVIPGTEGITPGPGVELEHRQLQFAALQSIDLTAASFESSNLSHAILSLSTLTDVNLNNAVVAGANFGHTTSRGFAKDQLYATASYGHKSLRGILLGGNDLSGWDFRGQDLTGASFDWGGGHEYSPSWLSDVQLTDALISGVGLHGTTSSGFIKEQLYSTASYRAKDLHEINLGGNDLSGWDFSGQDLNHAKLNWVNFDGADLRGANLTGVYLNASLTSANLTDANVTNVFFASSTLIGADLTRADLRGSQWFVPDDAIVDNTILPDGIVMGINLGFDEVLVIRDYDGVPIGEPNGLPGGDPISVTIQSRCVMNATSGLRAVFDSDPWDSLISFEPNIPVQLGGTLELTFADDVDVATQIRRTIRIFDWTGVEPTGAFTVSSLYPWDVSQLYATGEVTLLLPGDTNSDQAVDLDDLNNVRNTFGLSGEGITGDTNNDQTVDLTDLNNVRNFFGVTAPQPVPEPTGIALAVLLLASLGLAGRFRRQN